MHSLKDIYLSPCNFIQLFTPSTFGNKIILHRSVLLRELTWLQVPQQESSFKSREFARANVQLYTYHFLAVATR